MNYAKLKEVQEKALAQGEHLGTLCWWSLNGATIDTAALSAKAKAAGLDERYLPKPIKAVVAFRRGWRSAARRCPSGLMLREIGETPERIEVGLVKEDADVEHASLDYGVVGRITFEKATETTLPSWSFEVVSHQVLHDEVVVHARLRAGDVVKEDFGAHEVTKSRHDGTTVCVGDDLKSAASDALKRCARLMGVALDLYRGGGDAAPHAPTPIRRPVQLATDAQVSKLRALAAQRRVDLDAAVFDRFGVTATDLTKSDASTLIDELLGKTNGARVNGQAHRHA